MNRNKTSTMFLAPSSINYIYSEHYSNIRSDKVDQSILDLADKISINDEDHPKIQAVEKDGRWFTLNNSQLELCRRLEMDGKCQKVRVDIVPLSGIPQNILRMMVVPQGDNTNGTGKGGRRGDTSRTTSRGYQKLQQGDGEGSKASDESDDNTTSSESSGCDDTDSECDWSIDDHDSSDCDATSSDDEDGKGKSENEQDSLL